MKKIKIGYFADGPWSHLAFEKIINDNSIEIMFVVPRNDTTDKTLENYARKNKVEYFKLADINKSGSLNKIKTFNCDLLVSMSYNQIFKKEIIQLTKNGIINCHAGKLPFYRGRNILNWVLINDEKEFGITVHFVDKGIDTGDIIIQDIFEITDSDTYKTLLELAYLECANLIYKGIKKIQSGDFERKKQIKIHPIGMYCGRRGPGDEVINWNDSSRNIFNFIRSICSPGPSAITYLDDIEVEINSSTYLSNAPIYIGKPGQVLSKTNEGYLVKTKDSFIEIKEISQKLTVGKILK